MQFPVFAACFSLMASLIVTDAQAGSFVLDDFSSPSPPVTIVDVAGLGLGYTTADGPYFRALTYKEFGGPGGTGARFRIGGGDFRYDPGPGTSGETDIRYLADGGPVGGAGSLDLTPYNYVRLDFAAAASVLNLNFSFYTGTPFVGTKTYYTNAGVNYTFEPTKTSTYIPIGPLKSTFNFGNVNGLSLFIDRSGAGTASFDLRRISFVTTLPPVPEPSTWSLMLTGLVAIGASVRRRKSRTAAIGLFRLL